MISGHYQADNMIIYVLSKNLVILLQLLSPKNKAKVIVSLINELLYMKQ